MCNSTTRHRTGSPNLTNDLHRHPVKHGPTFVVLLDNKPCRPEHCRRISVLKTSDMKLLPNCACVKGCKMPPGCALCFGELEGDCPFIFVSGGDGRRSKEIWLYDVLLDHWEKLGKMRKPHSGHRMHCVNNQLYVIGGISDGLIEMYDLVKLNKSEKIIKGRDIAVRACLKVKVYNFTSVVYDDKIYVFGGISDNGPVRCVQYFDTRLAGSIGQLPDDMPCECHGGAAAVVNKAIYIATQQGLLVRFDPATGKFCLCMKQPFSRKNFALVERDNKLCIFGGEPHEGQSCGSLPDCVYDPNTDTWVVGGDSHSCVVSASCAVEYSKPCMFSPFRKDPYSHVPHICTSAKL